MIRFIVTLVGLAFVASLFGCATTPKQPPLVFEPESDENTISFYVAGEPYSTSITSCGEVTFHLTVFSIAGHSYMGAFVHYSHTDDESFLLEPLEDFTLRIIDADGEETIVLPRSPTELERSIEASKNAALFAQALFAGISAAAVRPTMITGPGGTYKIDDTAIKCAIIAGETADAMAATQASADMLADSVHSHMLRKHTLFPNRNVAGFVYFPAKGAMKRGHRITRARRQQLEGKRFELSVDTPCGTETVVFVPVDGE